MKLKIALIVTILVLVNVAILKNTNVNAQSTQPTIGLITRQTSGNINKYSKFEISFDITNSTATNPYFPYDSSPPSGVIGTGITVDMLLLPPGESNWESAKIQPCFYFQPYEQVGTGNNISLLPVGSTEWRCRFTPETIGNWQYKVKATDSQGTTLTNEQQFNVIDSKNKGFIKISQSDPKQFEFSNGEPFPFPLINIEEGSPFSNLSNIRANIQKLGESGIKFVRWLPTAEGANYYVIPFGDQVNPSWAFGPTWGAYTDIVDTQNGKKFSYNVYYYSQQNIPLKPGATYKLTVRSYVSGNQVLRLQMDTPGPKPKFDICSQSSTYHESTGNTCDVKVNGWSTQSFEFTNSTNQTFMTVFLHGLYVSTDAPNPFNNVQTGTIRISQATLQRDETGNNGWGSNLLTRSNSDTYNHVDQIGAARLDEIFNLSEQYGVYHKLPMFEKNDEQLNRIQSDGSTGNWYNCGWGNCPNNFYSAPDQAVRWFRDAYTRYFVGRWSYSPALHSLELANETDLYTESYNAGWDFAQLVKNLSPRNFLMSNSFWGYFADPFFTDPQKGNLLDFGDQHLYGSIGGNGTTVSTIWSDSVAYVRECRNLFRNYQNTYSYNKPIVRGEGGTTQSGTEPQHPQIAQESTGIYYHKKIWSHVGNLGVFCDGDWYPRLFVSGGSYPNQIYDTFKIYKTYSDFINGEPINSGNYQEIGTDLSGNQLINSSNANIRAFGVRDSQNGKVLLWIDNSNQTWTNPTATAQSANLTIQGLPAGDYSGQWWDPRTGSPTTSQNFSVSTETFTLPVTNLASDIAIKLTNTSITPTSAPTVTTTPIPCPKKSSGDSNCDNIINLTDFIIWKSEFVNPPQNKTADFNNDEQVNLTDFIIWKSEFVAGG